MMIRGSVAVAVVLIVVPWVRAENIDDATTLLHHDEVPPLTGNARTLPSIDQFTPSASSCDGVEGEPNKCLTTTTPQPTTTATTMSSRPVVQSVFPLGRTPWKTFDPFLFSMHHKDQYPTGLTEYPGPDRSLLRGRDIGSDFSYKDGWSMYHGDRVPGFPVHPHRGFETISVVRQGLIDHCDSIGAAGRYGDGDTQWMTAGAGIQHSEMFPLLHTDKPNTMEMFQVWLNLPAASKMVQPHFTMFWSKDIPRVTFQDDAGRTSSIRVVAGAAEYFPQQPIQPQSPPPESWASRKESDVCVWEISIPAGGSVTLPPALRSDVNRAVYLFDGPAVTMSGTDVKERQGVKVDPTQPLVIQSAVSTGASSELLLLQGRPIGEPVVQHGPFVMNTQAEIQQTFSDFRRTQFGGWPWGAPDFTHDRQTGHFAKHADGTIEKPAVA